jgi:hypothetical protein
MHEGDIVHCVMSTTRLRDAVNRPFYLPRLPREYYQGDAVVHWTFPVELRATGWLDDSFHLPFRELMVHTTARYNLLCPIYSLMPDHLHFVWMGLSVESDQMVAIAFFKDLPRAANRACQIPSSTSRSCDARGGETKKLFSETLLLHC